MPRFTLTIELPDGYDTSIAEEAPDEVAQEILNEARGITRKLPDSIDGWALNALSSPHN